MSPKARHFNGPMEAGGAVGGSVGWDTERPLGTLHDAHRFKEVPAESTSDTIGTLDQLKNEPPARESTCNGPPPFSVSHAEKAL